MTLKRRTRTLVEGVRVCLQKGGTTIFHQKRNRKSAKPQGKRAPQKPKALKIVKVKVEFWAATMPEATQAR